MDVTAIIKEIDQRIAYYQSLAESQCVDDPEIANFYQGGANSLKILASWLETKRLT